MTSRTFFTITFLLILFVSVSSVVGLIRAQVEADAQATENWRTILTTCVVLGVVLVLSQRRADRRPSVADRTLWQLWRRRGRAWREQQRVGLRRRRRRWRSTFLNHQLEVRSSEADFPKHHASRRQDAKLQNKRISRILPGKARDARLRAHRIPERRSRLGKLGGNQMDYLHWHQHERIVGCAHPAGRVADREIEVLAVGGIARFATDLRTMEAALATTRRLVDTSRQVPESPFLRPAGARAFCDFHHTFEQGFAEGIARLARQQGDEQILLVSLPDPRDLLLPDGRSYGALVIPTSEMSTSFAAAMLDDPPGAGLPPVIMMIEFVMTGSTETWSVWASREWSIAVVQTDSSDTAWRQDDKDFFNVSAALTDFVEFNLRPESRTDAFRSEFLQNFA